MSNRTTRALLQSRLKADFGRPAELWICAGEKEQRVVTLTAQMSAARLREIMLDRRWESEVS